jgi:hypothetical protein
MRARLKPRSIGETIELGHHEIDGRRFCVESEAPAVESRENDAGFWGDLIRSRRAVMSVRDKAKALGTGAD